MSVRAEDIARVTRAKRCGGGWLGFCPAHDNTKTPALSFKQQGETVLVHCFSGCDGRDVIAALQTLGAWPRAKGGDLVDLRALRARAAARKAENPSKKERRAGYLIDAARKMFADADRGGGTLAETYLREGRALSFGDWPQTLRFAEAARHPSRVKAPAMIAAVQQLNGRITGVHRTFLAPDGLSKADLSPAKLMLGTCAGGAVRLTPKTGPRLIIAEGIETAIAAASRAVGDVSVWAALSTSGLKALRLPPLPLAAEIIVAADHDDAGLKAAEELAKRARREGRKARVVYPHTHQQDFADAPGEAPTLRPVCSDPIAPRAPHAYAAAAFTGACKRIRAARGDGAEALARVISRAAFSVGPSIKAGLLDHEYVAARLAQAAAYAGANAAAAHPEILRALRNGANKGRKIIINSN